MKASHFKMTGTLTPLSSFHTTHFSYGYDLAYYWRVETLKSLAAAVLDEFSEVFEVSALWFALDVAGGADTVNLGTTGAAESAIATSAKNAKDTFFLIVSSKFYYVTQ